MPGESGAETFIPCRSADRMTKERAMRERFEKRIETGLVALQKTCEKRRCDPGLIQRRVGRLLGLNTRAARLFDVQVTRGEPGGAALNWSKRTAAVESAQRREGCYLLRSNVAGWTAPELWKAYIPLTEAEAAFRIQKDNLRLRRGSAYHCFD